MYLWLGHVFLLQAGSIQHCLGASLLLGLRDIPAELVEAFSRLFGLKLSQCLSWGSLHGRMRHPSRPTMLCPALEAECGCFGLCAFPTEKSVAVKTCHAVV